MKAFYTSIAICLLVVVAPSCSKQKCDSSDNTGLPGTWKWVRTDGGFAFHIHDTPASTGKNINLKLTSDFHYFVYTNGTLTSQGTYSIITRNCIHDHTDKKVIDFSSASEQDMMIEKLSQTDLELSDDAYDGTGSKYIRE